MSQSDSARGSRFKSLPVWFRLVLAVTPVVVCLLAICAASLFFLRPQPPAGPKLTEAADLQTLIAAETAQRAERVLGAAGTATAIFATQQAADSATGTALASERLQSLTQQFLTQAALPPTSTARPSETVVINLSGVPPTITATLPESVALTLLECRGYDGTVVIDGSGGQSLHAFSSLSFTLSGGGHSLVILWLDHPDQNVSNDLFLRQDTTLVYGDKC